MPVDGGVPPDPSGPIPLGAIDRPIVAGENDDRVLFDSELGKFAQKPADMVVELDDEVPVRAGAAFPDEFSAGDDRVMRRCHRVVEEERLIGPCAGCRLDEFAGLL